MKLHKQLIFVLNLLLPTLSLSSLTCSSAFLSENGIELYGFVFKTFQSKDLKDCFTKCMENRVCQSINYNLGSLDCQFNRETKRRRPSSVRSKYLGVYMENPKRDKKGSHSILAAHSCKEINDLGEAQGDGEYWIDPENTGKPFTVYCDMKTDSGGWTLVKQTKLNTTTPGNANLKTSDYRAITNYSLWQQNILIPAVKKLKDVMGFQQLRWRCHKKSIGRTLHVQTTNDTAGHKVLDHFLVKPSWPTACNSFQRLPDDNSILAQNCIKWGNTNSNNEVNKWGRYSNQGDYRIYNYAIFWVNKHYLTFCVNNYFCDDYTGINYGKLSIGDIWELYVR